MAGEEAGLLNRGEHSAAKEGRALLAGGGAQDVSKVGSSGRHSKPRREEGQRRWQHGLGGEDKAKGSKAKKGQSAREWGSVWAE